MASLALPIASSLGSLIGGLFGGKPATSSFNSTGTTSNVGSQNFNQAPVFDPAQTGLRANLIGAANQQLTQAGPDLSGYQSQMLQNNNTGYNAAQNILRQTLTARGLTYSPLAGGAEANLQTQRIGGGINIMNQMPMLREQLLSQRLNNALNVFRGLPYGTSGSGTSTTRGTTSQSGTETQTQAGGMMSGLGAGLAGAAPQIGDIFNQLFGGQSNSPGSSGTFNAPNWMNSSSQAPPTIIPNTSNIPTWLPQPNP
jgi:hypothetical protein